jgi:2-polyprenyl-3-methyl-5-hydroxy-6-metoxy-1,4-benzoquinol methylase
MSILLKSIFNKDKELTAIHQAMKQVIGERVLWALDSSEFNPETGEGFLSGWLIDSRSLVERSKGLAFIIGGEIYPLSNSIRCQRDDVLKIFRFLLHEDVSAAKELGFSLKFQLGCVPSKSDAIEVTVADLQSGTPKSIAGSYFISCREKYLVPRQDARYRVQGDAGESSFLNLGLLLASHVDSMARQYAGVCLEDAVVLDWGCGCGKVARYLADRCRDYTGIDIDKENLRWCADNLPGAYHHIDTSPPTRLESSRFDLIFGVSVFSHLTEASQYQWLAELARLAKPGATVMVSTLGSFAACRSGNPHTFEKLKTSGYLDLGADTNLEGIAPDGYYRTAFHSRRYIESNWSDYFSVVDIIEGAIGGHQDFVVLRKAIS